MKLFPKSNLKILSNMKSIHTYVINLKTSEVRRRYMEDLLRSYNCIEFEFIDAVDGRKLSEQELLGQFDMSASLKRYGRELNRGEIGCVLSHRKVFENFLKTDFPYALVFEDDISIIQDLNKLDGVDVDSNLDTPIPTIMFLSGDFWYYKKETSVVPCYDALGAYAYMLNRAAAQLLLSYQKPYFVADDWCLHKRKGLKLKAIKPYMVDANLQMDILSSDIQQYQWGINRTRMSIGELMSSIVRSGIKRTLKALGLFEAKSRVIDGKVVDDN